MLNTRTTELKNREQQLLECEGEILQLQNQVACFQNELNHLKQVEEKYRVENTDLQKRIEGEEGKNSGIKKGIMEFE